MAWIQRAPKKPYKPNDDIITKLAAIHGVEDIDEFLDPSRNSINEPYLLKNIDTLCQAIVQAIRDNKRIAIFADVDADGICSGAMMFNYLRNYTDNLVICYNQRSEGHGLVEALPNQNIPDDIDLLIAVDSSSNDVEACETLSKKGIQVLIIDHHPIESENPYAIVVNCQQDDYPNKFLSGAGHVWQVCRELGEYLGDEYANDLVDLAAVGIQGDAMNMREPENRAIVAWGLDNVVNNGLVAILKAKKQHKSEKQLLREKYTSTTIGFTIAPMLNGASRLDRIDLAIGCLIEPDPKKALKIAKEINELNEERKDKQRELADMLEPQINHDDKIIVVIDRDNVVGKNMAGLIAGELVSRYKRPACVVTPSGESGKCLSGSFRSVDGFDLRAFLESLGDDYYVFVAGHAGAGGVGFKEWEFDNWKKASNEALKDTVFDSDIVYDLELKADELSEHFIETIQKFTRINGQGMPEAKFKITELFSVGKTLMGSKQDTIKIDCDPVVLMKFRSTQKFFDDVPEFDSLEAVGSLNVNKFYHGGEKRFIITNQVFIDDYKVV